MPISLKGDIKAIEKPQHKTVLSLMFQPAKYPGPLQELRILEPGLDGM